MDNQKIANRVGKVTIIWNIILSVTKFIAGIVGIEAVNILISFQNCVTQK